MLNFINIVGENAKLDYGDFQTPPEFAFKVCQILKNIYAINPRILIEPTAGLGNFVFAALETFKEIDYVYCVDLQDRYKEKFTEKLQKSQFQAKKPEIEYNIGSIFNHSFSKNILSYLTSQKKPSILIIGNPPWVTNSTLSKLGSENVPKKRNFKQVKGFDSLTGKSNFDIAENIILSLIRQATQWNGICHCAFLCKDIVIRNILYAMPSLDLPISDMYSIHFDAKKLFKINASASLFLFSINGKGVPVCKESEFDLEKTEVFNQFGWFKGKFTSNIDNYIKFQYLDGKCPFIWRQGIKHDLIDIMVLKKGDSGDFLNGCGEIVDIEEEYLFPLLKSSALKRPIIQNSDLYVIVPQKSLNESTEILSKHAPRLNTYLYSKLSMFSARKSKIYKNRSPFAIFGIGDYAFLPYKIAVSGFYKTPLFALVMSEENMPIMLDDTCYYLSFSDPKTAVFTWLLFQLPEVKDFLSSITFIDAKRPYTKDILMRLDINKLAHSAKLERIFELYTLHQDHIKGIDFTESEWEIYLEFLKSEQK